MMTNGIFPPSLTLTGSSQATNDVHASTTTPAPNLMPFSIDYTGPANVDGYLVVHDDGSDSQYSHFRGRRIYNTRLALPNGWHGDVYRVQHDQTVHGAVEQGESSQRISEAQSAALAAEKASLLRHKKRRRLAHAARTDSKPAKAVMASFSMDDDDDEEGEGERVPESDDEQETQWSDDGPLEDEEEVRASSSESMPSAQPNAFSTVAPLSGLATTLSPHKLNVSPFTHLNVWSPDGPLDMGDEELVKVLGEWNKLRTLVSL